MRPFLFYREVFTEAGSEWNRNNVLRLSAALAYYAVFSIAPLLIIAMSLAGWIFGPEAVRGQLDDQLQHIMGAVPAKAIQSLIQSASQAKDGLLAAVIGFVTLLIGASGVFGQVKDALNEIWCVKSPTDSNGVGQLIKGFLTARLMTFGMVLVIGFLLLVSLVLSTALAAAEKYAGGFLPIPAPMLALLGFGSSSFMEIVLFTLLFKVLPDARVRWLNAARGGFFTAVLFEVGKWLLGFYLGRESTTSSYGAAGSLVLILLWFYYTSLIFFTGAVLTHAWTRAQDAGKTDAS